MNNSLNDIFLKRSEKTVAADYQSILTEVQKYCTSRHKDVITADTDPKESEKLLKELIAQYLVSESISLPSMTTEELSCKLYDDMAGYSFLQKWLSTPGLEELNINSYDDLEIIMSGKRSMKIPDKFASPQQAIDIIRRMLASCGMIIDDTMPSVLGYLQKNVRISVDKWPIVDNEAGINASIRIVNQQSVGDDILIRSGSATQEMLFLLIACIRYGVSVCIAGATGSGKTTIMAWLLSKVPNDTRLITIEEGSREFDLVKRDADGNILNSVAHLLTRPHENPALNIDQEFLLERVLRKHAQVVGVGEMRSAAEAMAGAEASRTGTCVVTTTHSNSAAATYRRMMTLAKLRNNIDDELLMQIMVEAYPIVVYTKQLQDGSRKIMEIIEGQSYENGKLHYQTLYRYEVQENRVVMRKRPVKFSCQQLIENGTQPEAEDTVEAVEVMGQHRRVHSISDNLKQRFLDNGIPTKELEQFCPIN